MKMSALRLLWVPVLLCLTHAWLCRGVCVEVESDREAVMGKGFKLACISCKMRGEVPAFATVDWWFMAKGESEFVHIYSYANMSGYIMDDRFDDRLAWNGSKKTNDVQDGSIFILNVTFNDTGTYRCFFDRTLVFRKYKYRTDATKFIDINVVDKATRGMASISSEIIMYVSLIVLQSWLLVEMVHCYRTIAAAEKTPRASTAEY
ncbi:sodium channel subunit beta-1-like [Carassius gibelio]|uniref:sodium channel subunit beta-1-like n=1 Tax=Carassius gibelio TaxID=101364 RepID=UPI002279AF42|nr:sodium channel subunit beta-1-like [Carassius gibelio]